MTGRQASAGKDEARTEQIPFLAMNLAAFVFQEKGTQTKYQLQLIELKSLYLNQSSYSV